MKVYTKNSGEVLKDFKHGSNNIRLWLEKNYAVEKLGKEVRRPETEDQLVSYRHQCRKWWWSGLRCVYSVCSAAVVGYRKSGVWLWQQVTRVHWSESLEEEVKKVWERGESTTWTRSSLSERYDQEDRARHGASP